MEAFISSMISAGEAVNRPPHILLADFLVTVVCSDQRGLQTAQGQGQVSTRKTNFMTDDTSSRWPSKRAVLGAFVLSALIGFAAVYVTLGLSDNAGPAQGARKVADKVAKELDKGAKHTGEGDLSAFVEKSPPAPLADVSFVDATGAARTLSDFRGKTILLNLWATWCAPCKAEMPSLDRLQHQLGSDKFEVVALALDRKGRAAVRKFLDDTKSSHLNLYIDETAKAGSELKAVGMPVTILIDPEGREVGRLVGPAEWDSPAAIARIKAVMESAG